MKIGDKVRFLNDVGGGIITGFQDKNTVLVCGDDGFEIPTLVKDVVVIDTDDYNIAKKVSKTPKPKPAAEERKTTSVKQALAVADDEEEEEETDPADLELSYRPMAQERRGANELNLLLAFVPRKPKAMSDTPFEAYLVNDCNYYVHYSMLSYADNACTLRHEGEIAPNTKIFLEEFTHNDLHTWERITLQTLAFKRDKLFLPKPVMSINLRIDGTKFYKLHAFQPNMFFNAPALIYEVIKNDKAARDFFVDADELREAMQTPQTFMTGNEAAPLSGAERRATDNARKRSAANEPLVIDLHAHELLDTMVGLAPKDILDYQLKVFHDTMRAELKHKGRRIVFIHGKGDGVLRNALIKELTRHYAQANYQDASFREYGYGATLVTIG